MAYASIVHLLKNVNLTPDYSDTLVFTSVLNQSAFFLNKTAYHFNDLMYVRSNVIRIDDQAGLYRTCTYIMYQNPDMPNKWFYGFITNVEYVNDGTTRIYFNEDVLQTWYFEMNIMQCFVQREHVNDDSIGNNIKEEPVALGPYTSKHIGGISINNWKTIVGSAVTPSNPDQVAIPTIYDGVINGLYWYLYQNDEDGTIALSHDLQSLATAGKSDAIVSMWSVPGFLVQGSSNGFAISPNDINHLETLYLIPFNNNFNGYIPKNNKLLTYPYNSLEIFTSGGQAENLRYDMFDNVNSCTIAYRGSASPNGRILIYPKNYEGITSNFNYTLSLGDFPQCSWIQDVYSNWLATQSIKWDYELEERAVNWAADMVIEGTEGLAKLASGNIGGGMQALADMAETTINYEKNEFLASEAIAVEKEIHKIIPPSVKGSIGSDSTMLAISEYGFKVYAKFITKEYAQSIDDYFSMFGYRVDRLKIPNIFGRESWNYVKCAGAEVMGNAPIYAKEAFKTMLNNGIRFWHGDYIGDFSRSNNIVEVNSQ